MAETANTTPGKGEPGFEEQYQKLVSIVEAMQDPEASLQESFENYKLGMMLVQNLNGMIDGIEKEVRELSDVEDPV